ncbi:MAG TPA: serine hydrolase domain-containing protein [Actinophytocola sp.]|jgi:CubicO group peptidase (beta-lactamase class C family)|uniref:serine hydrolase domain-containing protein n=1 Tax=Actinophytocola sp. TaxID=1872138 RepID=UPI002F93A254
MTDLREILSSHVDAGTLPGAVGIVARGERMEVAAVGAMALGGPPMTRDSIFRIASITKPITAAAVMTLVEDGLLALDSPVREWLPELSSPMVLRTPSSPLDDVVPAVRPITVFDLLSAQAGFGFAADFSLPGVRALAGVQRDGREPQSFPPPDEWMAALGRLPLLYQPGESWLYDTCSAVQGVLVARVTGETLPDYVASRLLEPLGMVDSGYVVPPGSLDRFTSYYRTDLSLADAPDGQWSTMPAFPLGSGGMVGTADDWLSFGEMLLSGGVTASGRRVLSPESVSLMTTDHTTPAHREIGSLFLEGQGWGFGGGVDISRQDPWNVPGRYGWVGGTGTTAHIIPATGTVAVLLAQVATEDPVPPKWMRDFWLYAANS